MNRLSLLSLALTTMFFGCAEPNMNTATPPEPDPMGKPSTVAIMGHDGTYVSCELGLEGENKAILVSRATAPGDWEKFTMWEKPDGKVSLQAANGKFVCSDEFKEGLFIADRDQAGDWESFVIVPQEGGKVALQCHNGSYVTADHGLTEIRRGALFGNRTEVHEWELFTLITDTISPAPAIQ